MYHLDIPKTRQYDHGKIEVIARSSVGEARTETTLTVKPRSGDYRGVLKTSPRRKYQLIKKNLNLLFINDIKLKKNTTNRTLLEKTEITIKMHEYTFMKAENFFQYNHLSLISFDTIR